MTPVPINTTDNLSGNITSAWARGPPSAAPSTNPSQPPSGAATPSQGVQVPHNAPPSAIAIGGGGHSRKNSLLVAGNADFKKGNLAFGTVDSPSAALSSSPAAPSMTGGHLSDAVKSFGSIDAADKQGGPDAIGSRRSSMLSNAAAGPSQGKKLSVHALFSSKAPQPHTTPQPQPVMSPPQQHNPPAPIHHNRRQSFGHNGGAFQQPMAGSPNQHFVGSPHMRPPGAHPRSPVLNHNVPFNPSAPQQIQHGFRAPQQPPIRPNNMPRGGPGQYGMHSGPQGPSYPMMGFPQGNFYPGGYIPYEQQQQQNFGGPPAQWAPQLSQPSQQHFGGVYPPSAPGPVSPRAQSQVLPPQTQSPLPPTSAVASEGTSPVPTPPMRPPSLMGGHHHSLSNAPLTAIPHQSTGSSVGGPPAYLSGNATNFAPRKSAAVKISRPDGTALDLENMKETAKPETAPSTIPAPVSTTPGPDVLKKRALPTVVRIESEEQRQKRIAEEARAKELKDADDVAEKERKERMEKKAKEEQERKDKEAKEKMAQDASEKAAVDAKKTEEEKEKFEKVFAAQAVTAKRVEEEKAAAAKAALEQTEEAKEDTAKAHSATLEARSKAEEQLRAIVETPNASVAPSPMGSPALGVGLPAKPVAALGASKRTPPSALNLASSPSSESPAPLTASASALTSARPIDDITSVNYPGALLSPSVDLNRNAEPGKFRYDRGFLMQFMNVCREKPESLPPLEDLGLDVDGSSGFGGRGGVSRGSRSSMGPSSRAPGGSGGIGLGIGGVRSSYPNSFGTGQFGSGPGSLRGSTSESRYQASLGSRVPSARGAPGSIGSFSGLPSMGITNSRSGVNRGSQRGSKRAPSQPMAPPAPAIPISENAWTRTRLGTNDESSPVYIERKVKALLNKLTEEKFDPISKQILEWANKSANEEDHMTLKLVIKLIFEKATDEAHWSAMYAKLCRLIHDQLDQAVTETTADGKVYSGRSLFRRYLLGRCQQDFQSGWKAREDTAVAAAAKEKEDGAKVAEQEKEEKPEGGEKEAVLLSDEYYAAQKAKRRGLGLVQLIGEMFKLDILTYRVITECLTKLLANYEQPDEEDVESACKLLTTVGDKIVKANPDLLEGYFTALEKILKNDDLPSRIRFMIMDVQDLRRDGFRSQKNQSSVMTIAEIHKQAAKEKNAASARESISRGGSRTGGRRDSPQQPGDWQAVPGGPRVAGRPVDFAGIGRGLSSSARTSSPSFAGPTSVFSRKGGNTAIPAPPVSRSISSNMFSALTDGQENQGSSPARRDSGDAGESAPQRKKLSLAPRTKPVPAEGDEEEGEDEEGGANVEFNEELSEEQAKAKIDLDMKELWGEKDQGGSRNPEDVVEYFTSLPQNLRHLLASRLLEDVFRLSRPKDAEVVAKSWKAALDAQAVPATVLKEALEERIVSLDDDAVDFPGAYKAVGGLIRSLSLGDDDIQNLVCKIEVYGQPRVTPQQKLEKALKEIDEEA